MARRPEGLIEEELTRSVIGAFFEVYNTLGYGFLEHVYASALERELVARGHHWLALHPEDPPNPRDPISKS